jgi:hypothetical protein
MERRGSGERLPLARGLFAAPLLSPPAIYHYKKGNIMNTSTNEQAPAINGNFPVSVGGYGSAGLIIHTGLTILSVGLWLPVLITYLVGWRKRTVVVNVANGVVVGVS